MTMRLRKPMLLLGTTILVIQAVFMPVGMVYAETTSDTEEQEIVELPPMKNYLEEEQVSDPRFFFTRSRMQGVAEEPLQVTFFSDQEVSEARIFLPEEATLLKDQLSTGISVGEGAQPREWIVQSERAQNTFVLPLVFEKSGNYELSVEETTVYLEISEHEGNLAEGQTEEQDYLQGNESPDTIMSEFSGITFVNKDGTHVTGPIINDVSEFIIIRGFALNRNNASQIYQNVGTYKGSSVDIQLGGDLRWNSVSTGLQYTVNSQASVTLTAYYAGTSDIIDAPMMFPMRIAANFSQSNIFNGVVGFNTSDLYYYIIAEGDFEYRPTYFIESSRHAVGNRGNYNPTIIARNGSPIFLRNTSNFNGNINWYFLQNNTLPRYSLDIIPDPVEGGNPATGLSTMIAGETTMIKANPKKGYVFSRWEIESGIGSHLENLLESETVFTMGSTNTIVRAIYEIDRPAEVHVYHLNLEGDELAESEVVEGILGKNYHTSSKEIEHYQLLEIPDNASGVFSEDLIIVTYVYETTVVRPVDPTDPEEEVIPEKPPLLPEDQRLFSIDFASQFDFGVQVISVQDQTYYAKPQRLLAEDGTVIEGEKRPNYVQVSDRRSENERNGWQLAVTQKEQFSTDSNNELVGAQLQLMNQQLVTAQGGKEPSLQATNPLKLVPGNKRTLIRAEGNEGTGTWIYRFGNAATAGESVSLHVPKGATPEANHYATTLLWELNAVPGN